MQRRPMGISASPSVEGDGRVAIDITDTGSGMTPEFIRDRLFRPFDSTKGAQGMGIGAYQAREFARKLGGDLNVQSSPGRGHDDFDDTPDSRTGTLI